MTIRLALMLSTVVAINATAQTSSKTPDRTDTLGVRQAVLDYLEGVYNADTSRIVHSVSPLLAKRGYYKRRNGTIVEAPMTFEGLIKTALTWSKEEKIPADAPKEVIIFDISDKTASAKCRALWGIDYLQLAKIDGRWKIFHVMWQD
jgi:hypothetical protein